MESSLEGFLDNPSFVPTRDDIDLFSILERLEGNPELIIPPSSPLDVHETNLSITPTTLVSQNSATSSAFQDSETDPEPSPSCKRQKLSSQSTTTPSSDNQEAAADGQQRIMHITVERNRRKQMNEHLSVLRTLMPSFYVKRGDQASIIGGVVDYIKELQQVLQSLEAKKQRKVYSEVLSPRLNVSSPRPSPLSPRKPPLSPRVMSLPISPRTPRPTSPYKPRVQHGYMSPTVSSHEVSSNNSSSSSPFENYIAMELAANSKSSIADVEVKFSGPNVLLKTVSPRIPNQALKIIAALEGLPLEILHVSISTIDEAFLVNSFTIKIGVECKLSAEELAHEVQQTFC
ncbi:hypothetical protein Scep_025734 [Stephania cephalantha]|uniref:BHLH domain-containing protein n=1 Tax=Stephania cephalantha TaxID=152367 RepID=A0AAP0ELA8_9MAGN